MYKYILLLISAFNISIAHADILSQKQRNNIVDLTMKNFWGKAKNSNGEFIQPKSDAERNTVPVPIEISNTAISAGELSGLAQWCNLDWKTNYASLMHSARSKKVFTDTQLAFIAVNHGIAQGMIESSIAKINQECTSKEKSVISEKLKNAKYL
jgi:hypothetical protein